VTGRAAIVAVGSELLGSTRADTNSLWLSARLEEAGIPVVRKACVGDDAAEIRAELGLALSRAPLVVCTGGLGPTGDDLTKEAVAAHFGRRLVPDRAVLAVLRERWERRGLPMPDVNAKQALAVEGARLLSNPYGTAPGVLLEDSGRLVGLLPGVPREMRAMFDGHVLPEVRRRFGGPRRYRRVLRVASLGESAVEELVAPVYARWPESVFTILGGAGEVQIHLIAAGEEKEAQRTLDAQTRDFDEALGGRIYGRDEETLESVVGRLLRERGKSLALAESCTGGLIAERLTRVPGSSEYFFGAVVSYSNHSKSQLLGVRPESLETFGAVSSEVASEMAAGALERFHSDYALAATGVAGPGGGSEDKPVGMVWLALCSRGASRTRLLRLPGSRGLVRAWASTTALEMLRKEVVRG
jgi:nicotinamide-nucleotide amidase